MSIDHHSPSLELLRTDPYPVLAGLRRTAPVAWIEALGGWIVTRYDLAVQVLHDAATFTVEDPRFSTGRVVGPSMLSLDGTEHTRHRQPFGTAFRHSQIGNTFEAWLPGEARSIVRGFAGNGRAELRRSLAGPLAVSVMIRALDLAAVTPTDLLGWYDSIVNEVDQISSGRELGLEGPQAMASLTEALGSTGSNSLLKVATGHLTATEVASNAAVLLFGGIETAEGMTTNLAWHLLSESTRLDAVRGRPELVGDAIEESLRLEPAAARVDRYATRSVEIGGAHIDRGDLVIVSLTGANRDPDQFADPDNFDLSRANARTHLTFAQGPHACLGSHLARMESAAAITACLDLLPDLRLDRERSSPPSGLVFRKPAALWVEWGPPLGSL